ncbi:MAG: family 20 glycosylhydrolase, partial [Sphingomonadales bacterium]|nr:family 20 glycosylhydrolase [Sphingomonadales bacterium]
RAERDGRSTARLPADWGVYANLYNVEEPTFAFLENVMLEVMELFPSRYIHVGGDEAAKAADEVIGEIAMLAQIAQPTIALVTNAQREHMEFMESVEATAEVDVALSIFSSRALLAARVTEETRMPPLAVVMTLADLRVA